MRARRRMCLTGALVIALLSAACANASAGVPDNAAAEAAEMTVTVLKVGKADAIILEAGGSTAVIDTGEEEDGAEILAHLRKRGCDAVDLLLVTHFDKDHVGGAADLIRGIDVRSVVIPDYAGDSGKYRRFMEALAEKGIEPEALSDKKEISAGGMQFTVMPPPTYDEAVFTEKYDNNCSLVTAVMFGEKRFLFTGDIEEQRIRLLLKSGEDLAADVIKMPHHGRYDPMLPELLEAVGPSAALICDSDKNPAEEETLMLLSEKKVQTYETRRGDITVRCDGTEVGITQRR